MVGAQNAGKSSLLNAMRRTTGQRSQQTMDKITAAPLPGTTLGEALGSLQVLMVFVLL